MIEIAIKHFLVHITSKNKSHERKSHERKSHERRSHESYVCLISERHSIYCQIRILSITNIKNSVIYQRIVSGSSFRKSVARFAPPEVAEFP